MFARQADVPGAGGFAGGEGDMPTDPGGLRERAIERILGKRTFRLLRRQIAIESYKLIVEFLRKGGNFSPLHRSTNQKQELIC